ncbi:MAG: bifunctional DNA-formamidopyrimidine glycosylase/DNA-(apurinic or apyrimidinic site) lyase [Betaproteobacteria bacterium]|nr:bifunctional DNA-formamidopyrimidine glycosylase/DNA-(apurinic or apyrimidinic site) lyase [Betaproteobacteria bacterium]
MPELPEVETTRRGLIPLLTNQRIRHAIVRNGALRLPVPGNLPQLLAGALIAGITRRGKYLLFDCGVGTLILHLGMSGRLWIANSTKPPEPHDHFDLVLENGTVVRLRDPRRFGLVLWHKGDPARHELLADIGPEPFGPEFTGAWLYRTTRRRGAAIKHVLMDSRVVAGVGNIYANEALFRARIHPRTPARRIGEKRYELLAQAIRETLKIAIDAGGSTLRDYVGSDGQAGNFQSRFSVYDRAGEPCHRCSASIRIIRQGQRSTFYCSRCQR